MSEQLTPGWLSHISEGKCLARRSCWRKGFNSWKKQHCHCGRRGKEEGEEWVRHHDLAYSETRMWRSGDSGCLCWWQTGVFTSKGHRKSWIKLWISYTVRWEVLFPYSRVFLQNLVRLWFQKSLATFTNKLRLLCCCSRGWNKTSKYLVWWVCVCAALCSQSSNKGDETCQGPLVSSPGWDTCFIRDKQPAPWKLLPLQTGCLWTTVAMEPMFLWLHAPQLRHTSFPHPPRRPPPIPSAEVFCTTHLTQYPQHFPLSYTDILYLQLSLWPFYVFEHLACKNNLRAEQRPEQWLSQLWAAGHSANTWALRYMCVSLSKYLSPVGHLRCPLGTAWLAEALTEWAKILAKDITRARQPEKETKSPKLSERTSTMSMSVVVFSKNKLWRFKHLWYLLLTHALSFMSLSNSSGGRKFSYPEM